MFTGIVQGLCQVTGYKQADKLSKIQLAMPDLLEGLVAGASVAINGVCLTVTNICEDTVYFDVIQETLKVTNLGNLRLGSLVNVERSFRHGDEVGGHILSGHISTCARVAQLDEDRNLRTIRFSIDPAFIPYLMQKGFVALDGASLTISMLDRKKSEFAVSLIPETIARTTLGQTTLKAGSEVNLEIDSRTQAIVDTVREMLPQIYPQN